MKSMFGAERCIELMCSSVNAVGFGIPKPPGRAGSASSYLSQCHSSTEGGEELLEDGVLKWLHEVSDTIQATKNEGPVAH